MPGNFESQTFPSTFFAQVYNFGADHTSRVAKYQNCWDFYEGDQWGMAVPEGFDQITVNYSKAFVKKLRRFAFRNGWATAFPKESRKDGVDVWVNDVWKQNDIIDITNKVADFGGIFGDWFIYPQWLPTEPLEEDETPHSKQVKLSVLDPRYVFPQYNNKTGKMEFCVVVIPYEDYIFKGDRVEIVNKVHKEVHTQNSIFVQELDEKEEVLDEKVYPNPIGKILIVHGIHQPKAGSFYGAGIIEDIIAPQKLFNEKVSNISEILDYHAAPITVIYGAKARQLEKGANKIWSGLPANAKVENLSSQGNIPASKEFVQDTKIWMHELANIPQDSLGAERKISNTSAVALSIDFEPLIELSEDVRYYFAKGIKEVNERIIDIGIYLEDIKTTLKDPTLYEHSIEFGPLLPRDRALDLADISVELSLGLESPEGAMKRLGVKDIPAKVKEIDVWEEKKRKKFFELSKKYGVENEASDKEEEEDEKKTKKAVNKNPIVHGEQVSNEAKKKKS